MSVRVDGAREKAWKHALAAEALSDTLQRAALGDMDCVPAAPRAAERFPREVMLATMWAAIADVMRP